MADIEIAHLLFPDDAPKSVQVPAYVQVQQVAAEQRLSGQHANAPKPAGEAGERRSTPSASGSADDPATMLFKDDAAGKDVDYERVVGGKLDGVTLDAIKDGDQERAGALKAATAALTTEFRSVGAPPEEVAEALSILRDRPMTEPTPEEREASYASAVAALQYDGVTVAELNAARAMIRDYEQIAPGTIASLERYGAGNSPMLVKLAVAQAKRRGYLR